MTLDAAGKSFVNAANGNDGEGRRERDIYDQWIYAIDGWPWDSCKGYDLQLPRLAGMIQSPVVGGALKSSELSCNAWRKLQEG